MTHGHVCLTFDFDALSAWVARGITTATPLSRGEFAAVGARRLLKVLARRSLTSTWFVPAHTANTYPELTRAVRDGGHEIALHGFAHENVAVLEPDTERDLLQRSIDTLEATVGYRPTGFRAPSWDLSDNSIDLLNEQDLSYDSSLMGHDHAPYFCRSGGQVDDHHVEWGQETPLVEIPVSWSLDDFPQLEFLRSGAAILPGAVDPTEMFARWENDLRWMLRELEDGVLTVTCHPEVIGRGHRLLALEAWIDRLTEYDVEFTTCQMIADRVHDGAVLGRSL